METSLNTVENYVREIFPNYEIKTYVPPSNRIDHVGEAALRNAIPSISVLSSMYIPDSVNYTTVHEFDQGETFIHFLPAIAILSIPIYDGMFKCDCG